MLRKIFNILSGIVLAVIAVYIAVALPMVIGYHPVVVLSGSMEPSYPVGSITYYRKCRFEEVNAGDAITFRAGESLVTHRVEEKNELSRTFTTKGDNNETKDMNPVSEAELVGKTAPFAIPYLGYFVTYGKNMAVIVPMGVVLVVSYLLDCLEKKGKAAAEHEKGNPK